MANKTYNNGRAVNGGAEVIEKESTAGFPLVRLNFILMAVAGLMIVLGFVLMAGSGSTPTEFNPDIFSASARGGRHHHLVSRLHFHGCSHNVARKKKEKTAE